jgi:hypothetical protein
MDLLPSHFKLTFPSAAANPEAIVQTQRARFSILAPRLIRMEWSQAGVFEDRASQAFWLRKQAVPEFKVRKGQTRMVIETAALRLSYEPEKPFTADSLWVEVLSTGETWRFGDPDPVNLLGTARTLDGVDGATPLSPGLVSRSGWSVVDDSHSLVFNESGWLEARNTSEGQMDLYIFGYGHDYYGCLREFNQVSGAVPMIPRFVLGNWWSRYWEYSQDELIRLMEDFERYQVPLSVCIIDMDWHITNTGNACSGWTGYTWNRDLFPDPAGMLHFLHSKGLKVALNLHPAEGVHPHEAAYEEMSRTLGQDPAEGEPVEFDIANPAFVETYFRILHHPEEERGVDFWWMDWQQGGQSRLAGLDPLWWLNHLHFLDLGRDGRRRSFIFSRWGGLGNHRYPIGFSGDSIVTWDTLAFQPFFTATASNVNYGWWSHDIGGHFGGYEDPELYARWVQLGAFLPVFRLHSTKNTFHERTPWGHNDAEVFLVAKEAMQLRHALVPYLYSMAWRFHTNSIPPLLPMYYDYPEREESYACPNQYMFGDQLLVAPFITPRAADTRLSRAAAWLPAGDWYDLFTGQYYPGDGWHAMYGTLRDVPVFAKAGAIVPMGPKTGKNGVENPEKLSINILPGADGSFDLFEDEGNSNAYLQGVYVITPLRLAWGEEQAVFTLGPAQGEAGLLPAHRTVDLHFRGWNNPQAVVLQKNGVEIPAAAEYDASIHTISLVGIDLAPGDRLEVILSGSSLANKADSRLATCLRLVRTFHLDTFTKSDLAYWLPDIIEDPRKLGRYVPSLTAAQARALMETITGAGLDCTGSTGKKRVVLWNNSVNPAVRYQAVQNHLYAGARVSDLRPWEAGPLPKFVAFTPEGEEPGKSPWEARVEYYGAVAVKEQGK